MYCPSPSVPVLSAGELQCLPEGTVTEDRGNRNVLYVWNGSTFRSIIMVKRAYLALPFISTLAEMGYGMRPM